MTTLREHLEAIRDRHTDEADWMIPVCHLCDGDWPCPDRLDAVAALTILDDADWQFDQQRLVPDPKPRA